MIVEKKLKDLNIGFEHLKVLFAERQIREIGLFI